MAHVFDQWTRRNPGTNRRVRTERWGHGKRWLARWDVDGVRDSKAFATADEAEDYLAKIRTGIIDVSAPKGTPTVREWIETWRKSQEHQADGSKTSIDQRIERVNAVLGGIRLEELDREAVQDAVNGWAKSLAPATVKATYAVMTGAVTLALADKVLDASPCVGVKLPRLHRARVVPLATDQVSTIASRMPDYLWAMVWLGAASGMRGGEMCGLTPDRIDGTVVTVDRQMLWVDGAAKFGPPKTRSSNRVIDIGATAAKVLTDHMERFPLSTMGTVFRSLSGGPLTSRRLSSFWRPAIVGLGLKPRSGWHDLRHYQASLLIAAGLSVRAVADRLGHSDTSETLKTYAHLWPSDAARAVAAIEANLRPVCDLSEASDAA